MEFFSFHCSYLPIKIVGYICVMSHWVGAVLVGVTALMVKFALGVVAMD